MEFSYWISESEYASAWKMLKKSSFRLIRVFAWFMSFCLIVCVAVMLLWGLVYYTSPRPAIPPPLSSIPANPGAGWVVAFLLLIGFWAFLLFGFTPMRIRRMYRKDSSMRGQFTVSITPGSISTSNTAGTSSQGDWSVFKGWHDGKDVIVLLAHSGAYFILSLAGLTEPQRQEVRGILSSALPKK